MSAPDFQSYTLQTALAQAPKKVTALVTQGGHLCVALADGSLLRMALVASSGKWQVVKTYRSFAKKAAVTLKVRRQRA